jgi:hypothetical protein
MDLAEDLIKGAKAAAGYTGLTERQIYHLVENDALPVIRLRTRVLFFRKSDLDAAFSVAA